MTHTTPCCFKPESQEQAERIVKELEKRDYVLSTLAKEGNILLTSGSYYGWRYDEFPDNEKTTTESEFLAMASMTDDPNGGYGEWFIHKTEGLGWIRHISENYFWHRLLPHLRKATLEEIIEKFGRKTE